MDAPEEKKKDDGEGGAAKKQAQAAQNGGGNKQQQPPKKPAVYKKKKKDQLPPTTWERTFLRAVTGLSWMSEPNHVPSSFHFISFILNEEINDYEIFSILIYWIYKYNAI